MDISYDGITFISRNVFSKRPGEAISSLLTQEKLKELGILYQNAIYTCFS